LLNSLPTKKKFYLVVLVTADDEFISKLPDKYQTVLGEFGANISGGQRQRLAIARAIVNDPPVLILDESIAGLDPVSEAEVLNKLLFYRSCKTTILISHRPRVIHRADWIVLLESGKPKMQGSVEDLRSRSVSVGVGGASASEASPREGDSQPGKHLDFLTP
jgi:ATP-binding cassette, subfamily C, bacterial